MSQPVNSYNVLIDRFAAFAAGHYLIGDFTHGQLDLIDIPKDKIYPWMHVFPAQITQQPGQATYDWQVWFMDLPRDKSEADQHIRECISDCIRLAQDLIYEIDNGNVLFGRDVDLVDGATITPEIREFTHTLTGVQLAFSIVVPDDYDACAIPADYAVGAGPGSTTPGAGSLTFADSLVNTDGVVTLVNDEDAPGNLQYYGTDQNGVKGWYAYNPGSFNCSALAQCEAFTDLQTQAQTIEDTYVQSVTGLDTDNTDPQNPVVQIAVDGVTITGSGTAADPLVAAGGGGGGVASVSGESVDNTDPINPVVNAWPLAGTGADMANGTIEVDPAFAGDLIKQDDGAATIARFVFSTSDMRMRIDSPSGQYSNVVVFPGEATIAVTDDLNNVSAFICQTNQFSDLGTYPVLNIINGRRIQFDGLAAPTINDDSTLGYADKSFWIYDGRLWICTDDTTGAAVWNEVGAGGGGGITELTGDVTAGPGSGSQVATIPNNTIDFARMQDISTEHIIGRHSAGSGDPQQVGLGGGLEFQGANIRRTALTGDVTASAGSDTTTIANDAVTFAKMQNITTQRVIGRNTGGSGDPEEVTLTQLLDWIGSAAQGDLLYRGAAGWERLPAGTDGQILETQGTGANPQWIYNEQISFLPSDTDTSGSGTSNVNVAGAAVTLAANARYLVKFVFRMGCSGTGGMGIGITYPSGMTGTLQIIGNTTAFNAQGAFNSPIAASGTTTGTAFCAEAVSTRLLCYELDISTSATAGTLQFIIAGKNGAQTSTIYEEGSRVTYRRIS